MQVKNLFFLVLIYAGIAAHAQKPVFPKPNSADNIPFGKKLPMPAIKDISWLKNNPYYQQGREIQPAYFDTVNKQYVANRPGDRPYTPNRYQAKATSTQSTARPSGGGFHITKDINSLAESYPANGTPYSHYQYAVLNNVTYFSADDGIHGRELWRSDGTAAGTYMVIDIVEGTGPSNPDGIIAANGRLYFSAYSQVGGVEPWSSDGTPGGTYQLADVNPYGSSYPNQFVKAGGYVYFVNSVDVTNSSLWRTDGSQEGTSPVIDLYWAGQGYNIRELTSVNDMLFFNAYSWYGGNQLFRSDGTSWGTYLVKPVGYNDYYNAGPMQLTAYNNKLYFSFNDGSGRKLWVSDGTYDGTGYAPGNNEVNMQTEYMDIYYNLPFPIFNNALYVAGYTYEGGGGLYKLDASNNDGLVLVKDLTDAIDYPYDDVQDFVVAVDMAVVNDKLFFKVINNIGGFHDEIWVSNGETAGTQRIKTIGLNENSVYVYNLSAGNNLLFFVVNNAAGIGNELWKSDGTESGTVLVKDINPGAPNSYPDDLTLCNGKLIFRASTIANGSELWTSDGTGSGTTLVKDINTTSTQGSDAGFAYRGLAATPDGVVFNAYTPDYGYELYKSDGTSNGTALVNDIVPGFIGTYPNSLVYKNKNSYFIADDLVNTAIYKSNGTAAGLQRVIAYIDRSIYYVVNFTVTDNGQVFYILGNHYTGNYELWRSDGTSNSGTMLQQNLYYNDYVVTIGNTGYFVAGDNDHGFELWKSDGTVTGTKIVKDIFPGYNGSYPYSLFAYKNNIYFGAYDGIGYNYSLWQSDGTERGTNRFQNITPAIFNESFIDPVVPVFCVANSILYFTATDYNTYGVELWKTNGTIAGTKIVKDINPYSSYPNYLTEVKGKLFFLADDGIHGNELWQSDGTVSGTNLVKDIYPGYDNTWPQNLTSAGGKLFFFLNNYYAGKTELWSSDGTEANTKAVNDPVVNNIQFFSHLTGSGSKLFFGGYTPQYGTELYVGDVSSAMLALTTLPSPGNTGKLMATVSPNPSRDNAILKITGNVNAVSVTITDVSGRTTWTKNLHEQNNVSLPVQQMVAGMYIITVKNETEAATLKFIKQ